MNKIDLYEGLLTDRLVDNHFRVEMIKFEGYYTLMTALGAGMNGHLSKPIIMDEVIKTIARNLYR